MALAVRVAGGGWQESKGQEVVKDRNNCQKHSHIQCKGYFHFEDLLTVSIVVRVIIAERCFSELIIVI